MQVLRRDQERELQTKRSDFVLQSRITHQYNAPTHTAEPAILTLDLLGQQITFYITHSFPRRCSFDSPRSNKILDWAPLFARISHLSISHRHLTISNLKNWRKGKPPGSIACTRKQQPRFYWSRLSVVMNDATPLTPP